MTDDYGNELTQDGDYIESIPLYCTFPDCGCDGSRLCQAKNGASERCFAQNVEGMWNGNNSPKAKKAILDLMISTHKESNAKI